MPFDDTCVLTVSQVDDNRWRLERDLVYRGSVDTFRVPAGTETDFASVPRPLWWLVPRYGRFTRSAVLHDHLWACADVGQISRCDADGIFRRSMRELGVPFLQRWIMWAAVRLGAIRKHWAEPFRCGPASAAVFVLVALPALTFVLPVGLATVVFLSVFFVAEWLVAVVLRLVGSAKRVNPPRRLWYSESTNFGEPLPAPVPDGDGGVWQDRRP